MSAEIVRNDYVPGGFKRKEYKGSFLYYQYEMGGIFVDVSRERKVIRDTLAERLLDEGLISKKDFDIHIKSLKEIFSNMENIEDMSDEEVFGSIHEIRVKYLEERNLKILQDESRDRFFKESTFSLEKEPLQKILRDFFKDARVKIDKRKLLEEELKIKKKVILIPGSFRVLPFLIRLIFNNLLENNIEVSLLLKKRRVLDEPIPDDLDFLLNRLKLKSENMNVLTYDFQGIGLDLRKVNF